MIVTSDNTPLSAISTDTKTGSPTRTNSAAGIARGGSPPPMKWPTTTKTRTGRMIDPNAPSGSRRKILISSQVSFQRHAAWTLETDLAGDQDLPARAARGIRIDHPSRVHAAWR